MAIYLEIDASELEAEMNRLKSVMTPETFNRAMAGIFRRTGGHVRKILKQDLPVKYNIKPGEVGQAVKGAHISGGGISTGCSIPVVAPRRHIGGGGRGYTAYGHRKGWASLTSGHYDVSAVIYNGQRSTLPARMPQTGYPPFRNIPSKLGGLTFARASRDRLPIETVMGPAIPQMPMNRAQPDVQRDIMDYMKGRIEARFQSIIAGGR